MHGHGIESTRGHRWIHRRKRNNLLKVTLLFRNTTSSWVYFTWKVNYASEYKVFPVLNFPPLFNYDLTNISYMYGLFFDFKLHETRPATILQISYFPNLHLHIFLLKCACLFQFLKGTPRRVLSNLVINIICLGSNLKELV